MRATPTREHARETTPARVLADGARELPAGAYGIWAAAGVALTALLGSFAVHALSHGVLRYQY